MTHRFFSIWLEELNPSFQHDSKTFFHQRKLKEFDFLWLTDLNLLFKIFFPKNDSKNWSHFFEWWLSKCFLKYECDSQKFFSIRLTELIFFFLNMTFFLTLNFFFWIRLQELKFSNTTQRNNFFFSDMSQRIAPLFHMNFFYMTQRTQPFFQCESKIFLYESKSWTSFWIWFKRIELSRKKAERIDFLNMTQRIELFLNMTRKNWTSFWVWFKELNLFLSMTQKSNFFFWIRLNESNPFFWMWLKLKFLVEK